MNQHERFAVEHFLCAYPKRYTYEDVLDALREQAKSGIVPKEPEEYMEVWAHILHVIIMPDAGGWLAEEIETLREALVERFPNAVTYADEIADTDNPHAFTHLDTALLYADVVENIHAEMEWPHCFPSFQNEMSREEARQIMEAEDEVYKFCHSTLQTEVKLLADEECSKYRTKNVDYGEIATLLLRYWTTILNDDDSECE